MRLPLLTAALTLGLAGCGAGPVQTFVTFGGFIEHANKLLVVRFVEGGKEKLGTRQSVGLRPDGSCRLEFNLVPETPYRLQYFVDDNANGKWDGPVGQGEHSWDRSVSLPRPLQNHDSLAVTVGHDTNHSELPADFVAP